MTRNAQSTNAKRRTQSRETPSIPLKRIHDDIMRDNKSSTLTTKKMRAKLRVALRDVHDHNQSWLFTQSQYDVVRSMFDNAYAQRIARRVKRDATSRKRVTQSNVVDANVEQHENA